MRRDKIICIGFSVCDFLFACVSRYFTFDCISDDISIFPPFLTPLNHFEGICSRIQENYDNLSTSRTELPPRSLATHPLFSPTIPFFLRPLRLPLPLPPSLPLPPTWTSIQTRRQALRHPQLYSTPNRKVVGNLPTQGSGNGRD